MDSLDCAFPETGLIEVERFSVFLLARTEQPRRVSGMRWKPSLFQPRMGAFVRAPAFADGPERDALFGCECCVGCQTGRAGRGPVRVWRLLQPPWTQCSHSYIFAAAIEFFLFFPVGRTTSVDFQDVQSSLLFSLFSQLFCCQ
jgi:hypothetical protein